MLNLFLSEFVGFQVEEGFRGHDSTHFTKAERERWRVVALARGIPLIPAFKKNSRGDWEKIPECVCDVLCEGRKCLRHLAGLEKLKHKPFSGWRPLKRKRGVAA